ncbi:MAG TPA: class I SAM-dependent methyltransferase [Oculatellaceae cyanobacterium]
MQLKDLLSSNEYRENLDFWYRAWNMVKVPYTQMPDLPYLPEIQSTLTAQNVRTVLDLGCGSGWLSIYLARVGFAVTGIDVAAHAIDLARTWANQENRQIRFDIGDIADISYGKGSFDAVVANSIFEHLTLELAESTIEHLKELLKPGGVFIGCFDLVGTGPGEYYKLDDGTHVYTDKGRKGMMLRCFSDEELHKLFTDWQITEFKTLESGSRFVIATS